MVASHVACAGEDRRREGCARTPTGHLGRRQVTAGSGTVAHEGIDQAERAGTSGGQRRDRLLSAGHYLLSTFRKTFRNTQRGSWIRAGT